MELLLVRHGESQANTEGRMQGSLDSPLTERGREQARVLGRWLAGRELTFTAAYCSPLSRAKETAELLGEALGLTAEPLPDLSEIHAGQLQGLDLQGITAAHPSFLQRDITSLGDFAEFGGESARAVAERAARLTARLDAAHFSRAPAERVLVVAHGGILFQLVKSMICLPVPHIALLRFGNCTSTLLRRQERRGVRIGEVRWHLPIELIGGDERTPALGAFR